MLNKLQSKSAHISWWLRWYPSSHPIGKSHKGGVIWQSFGLPPLPASSASDFPSSTTVGAHALKWSRCSLCRSSFMIRNVRLHHSFTASSIWNRGSHSWRQGCALSAGALVRSPSPPFLQKTLVLPVCISEAPGQNPISLVQPLIVALQHKLQIPAYGLVWHPQQFVSSSTKSHLTLRFCPQWCQRLPHWQMVPASMRPCYTQRCGDFWEYNPSLQGVQFFPDATIAPNLGILIPLTMVVLN